MATLTELLGLKKSPLEQNKINQKFLELQSKGIVGKPDPRILTVNPSVQKALEKTKRETELFTPPDISTVKVDSSGIPTLDQILEQGIDTNINPNIIKERAKQKPKPPPSEFDIGTGGTPEEGNVIDATSSPLFQDPEAEAAKVAEQKEFDIATAPDEDMYADEMAAEVTDEENKKKNAQQDLFTEAMKEIETLYGDGSETKTDKTLDDYKADFAKATGIDISGEPDNRSALMALGLSLMQNRAGKGFDLSNILGEVGRAGQAALPKFEAARKEARAGQIAAGRFALQEQKADRAAALATAKEKRKALLEVGKQFRDAKFQRELEYIKHNNQMQIKLLEGDLKPVDAKGKVTVNTLEGNNFLKVDTAFVTGSRNRVFLAPVQQAQKHAEVYVNVLEAGNSITEMQNILRSVGQEGGSTAFNLLATRVKKFLKPLGIGDTDYSKGIDEIVKQDISAEQKVRAIQDRLISQYKKFLTKETGNGVSEGDINRLKKLIGEIELTSPLSDNINRLNELRTIFEAPKRALEGQFKAFSMRENFRKYNKTMDIIEKAIRTGTENTYNFSVGEDGVINIDLTAK
jgi:hypothetical protein